LGIYDELGIKPIINCCGTWTIYGGAVMPEKVRRAMYDAAKHFVIIDELHQKASEIIASITGAEAGLITAGADAGLAIASAACLIRKSEIAEQVKRHGRQVLETLRDTLQQLPDTAGFLDEVIIQRSHHNVHNHSYRIPGARLIEIGKPCSAQTEPFTTAHDLEAAISENTAAIAYVVRMEQGGLQLPEVIAIGHQYDVPIIVDAAAELPPRSNLQYYSALGVDLVAFSGGKGIRGPNNAGVLAGNRELIELAAIQYYPHMGVGRPMKVGREAMVGMLVALQLYVSQRDEDDISQWTQKAQYMVQQLSGLQHVEVKQTIGNGIQDNIPYCKLVLDEAALGLTAAELRQRLLDGDPRIMTTYQDNVLIMNMRNLMEDEHQQIVMRLREILTTDIP
jgi:L-seryl-tRNA(Ser) seleniumtransferase